MNKKLLIILITLILIIVGFSGCTQQDSSSDNSVDTQFKIQTNPTTPESLDTILEKAESINLMYYEIGTSINMPDYGTQTATIKIWQKLPYLKEQITSNAGGKTTTITAIQRPEGNYIYDNSQGKYILTTDNSSFTESLQYLDSKMIKKYLNNLNSTDFKTEIIDGKKATIIEYSPLQGDNLITIKIWIWNEKGLPLKAFFVMNMEEISMTMDFVFSNYSFSEIPDSIFSVL